MGVLNASIQTYLNIISVNAMRDTVRATENAVSTFDGLQTTVKTFRDVVDIFETLVRTNKMDNDDSKSYRDDLQRLIDTLRNLYNVPQYKLVYIDPGRMTKNVWGGIFWKFLHTSSILLQYAYCKNRINTFLNFPALLYNIDKILPCPVCIENYTRIKREKPILNVIEQSSFGLLATSVYRFHTIVNKNHESPLDDATTRLPFRDVDFALLYHCYPRSLTNTEVSVTFIKQPIVFHSREHVLLCLLLSLCYNVNIFHVSNLLMRRYGSMDFEYEPVAYLEDRDIKFILPSNDAIGNLLEDCRRYKRASPDYKSEYFKNVSNFKNITHYWSLVIGSSDYELLLDDGSFVVIKNSNELTVKSGGDTAQGPSTNKNPATVNNSFVK